MGMFASCMDWFCPFSASKAAAKFIKANHPDNMLLAGDVSFTVSPISGYLDRKIYYVRGSRFGSYIIYDKESQADLNPQEVLKRVKKLVAQRKKDALLILNYELETVPAFLVELKEFTNSIVEDENYYLYLLKYDRDR